MTTPHLNVYFRNDEHNGFQHIGSEYGIIRGRSQEIFFSTWALALVTEFAEAPLHLPSFIDPTYGTLLKFTTFREHILTLWLKGYLENVISRFMEENIAYVHLKCGPFINTTGGIVTKFMT